MAKCECADPKCPVHEGDSKCTRDARLGILHRLFRIDMEDHTGTAMCPDCSDDAAFSGLFYTKG